MTATKRHSAESVHSVAFALCARAARREHGGRQVQRERCALARGTLDFNIALHQIHQAARNGQSQPDTYMLAREPMTFLPELIENVRQKIG